MNKSSSWGLRLQKLGFIYMKGRQRTGQLLLGDASTRGIYCGTWVWACGKGVCRVAHETTELDARGNAWEKGKSGGLRRGKKGNL